MKAEGAAGTNGLVIEAEINSARPVWSCQYVTPKGNKLQTTFEEHPLIVVTYPTLANPTRNRITSYTSVGFTLIKNVTKAEWKILDVSLGSEHYTVETFILTAFLRPALNSTNKTDSTTILKSRAQSDTNVINSLEQWIVDQNQHVNKCTQEIAVTTYVPAADFYLL